jgi:hypothetical protein
MTPRIELRSWLCAALALAACTALAPPPARAQGAGRAPEQGPHFVLRAYYFGDSFSHSEAAMGVDTFTFVTYRGRPGGGLDAEYLFSPWVGLDFAAAQHRIAADEVTTSPISPPFTATANIQVRPFMLGIYGHFLHLEHSDLYIGPVAGLVQLTGGFRPNQTELGFGAALGLDVPLGSSGFAITGTGRVIAFRFPDLLRPVSHFRDDFTFGGGLAYRW